MYVVNAVAPRHMPSQTTVDVVRTLLRQDDGLEWIGSVLEASWGFLLRLLALVSSWLSWLGPPLTWTFQALFDAFSFVQNHPHPFHILGWSIFFGPIIILLPCLLLLELLILLLFQFSFIFHGMAPGSIENRFEGLKDYFMDWRESIFATVEYWTASVNKWTTDYPALLVLRLLAGAMSLYILFGIWSGW